MTDLKRKALARLPLPSDEVEVLYKTVSATLPEWAMYRVALESHERLRAELAGATVLIEEAEKREAELRQLLRLVRQNWDNPSAWMGRVAVALEGKP